MKQFTLNLNSKYQRPIIELKSWHNFEALLDTGALFPIWTADEKILEILGGKCLKRDVPFSGFGGKAAGNLRKTDFHFPPFGISPAHKIPLYTNTSNTVQQGN